MQKVPCVPCGEVKGVTAVANEILTTFNNKAMQRRVHCEKSLNKSLNLTVVGVLLFLIGSVFTTKDYKCV